MRLMLPLILTLLGCPTAPEGTAADCPTDRYLTDADMGCTCGADTLEALPGCGDVECTESGIEYLDLGCGTGGCKGVDCG